MTVVLTTISEILNEIKRSPIPSRKKVLLVPGWFNDEQVAATEQAYPQFDIIRTKS